MTTMKTISMGLGPLLLTFLVTSAGAQSPAPRMTLEVRGFDSDRGSVRCGLFDETGWGEESAMLEGVEAKIEDRKADCVFSSVGAGTYGIIAYHDENGNGRLDKNFLGIPTEDYCFSRGAEGGLGVPDFDEAALRVEGGPVVTGCKL